MRASTASATTLTGETSITVGARRRRIIPPRDAVEEPRVTIYGRAIMREDGSPDVFDAYGTVSESPRQMQQRRNLVVLLLS